MSEEKVAHENESSSNLKVSVEYNASGKDALYGVAGLAVLSGAAKSSPELAKVFKAAMDNGDFPQLASKFLATDDAMKMVDTLASSDDFAKVAGDLSDDTSINFRGIGKALKYFRRYTLDQSGNAEGGSETPDAN